MGVLEHITKIAVVDKLLAAGGNRLDIIVGHVQGFPKSPKLALRAVAPTVCPSSVALPSLATKCTVQISVEIVVFSVGGCGGLLGGNLCLEYLLL